MNRDSSIHITVSNLEKVLKRMGVDPSIAKEIARLSKGYSASHRNAVIDRAFVEKKIQKESLSDKAVLKEIYALYSMVVKKLHRFTPKRFKVGDSRTMSLVSTVSHDIHEFCANFDLEFRAGAIQYLEIGLEKSPKLVNLASHSEQIQQTYLAIEQMGTDNGNAEKLWHSYNGYLVEYTGLEYDVKSPNTMLKFKQASDWCDKQGIGYDEFIQALFKGLEWASGTPSPSMFMSDYAKQLVYDNAGKAPQHRDSGFTSINLKNLGQ